MNVQKINIIKYAAVSDSGRIRKENQDNLYCVGNYRMSIDSEKQYRCDGTVNDNAFFAVADGMGGEENGVEVALRLVCGLRTLIPPITNDVLMDYLHNCNSFVCDMIEQHSGARMGSTFVSLSIHNGIAEMANIGDSRIYLLRDTKLQCISKDDTLVRILFERGLLSVEQTKKHPDRHKLTQHIGVFPDELLIEPHTISFEIKSRDIFLLCSDGLTDALDDRSISGILNQKIEVVQKVNELFEMAYLASKDNITIIVVEII